MKAIYIDAQNVHRKTIDYGRIIDRSKLYIYLKEKYHIDIVYYAVGYIDQYKQYYQFLEKAGYTMIYKKTMKLPDGSIKGNVDIDIAIQTMLDMCRSGLQKAYVMTNDGDYNTLVSVCKKEGVFGGLIVPDGRTVSRLLTQESNDFLDLQRIRHLVERKVA